MKALIALHSGLLRLCWRNDYFCFYYGFLRIVADVLVAERNPLLLWQ